MKPGSSSRTAVLVCMARAAANGAVPVAAFSDPTALALLPEDARARVERYRAGASPRNWRERFERVVLERRSMMMVARTVAIDEAVRAAASPQVVILGAGLDGRAWRMAELRNAVVFEVDHPDTQREKRARAKELTQVAADVRFVPVDFTRDDLDGALTKAGHDPERATTWVWEGVVMYLTPAEIEATLAVIARRSPPGSSLTITYMSPAPLRWVVGFLVRRLGEPFKSAFTADAMHELLLRSGFRVVKDDDIFTIGHALFAARARVMRIMKHQRVATAERAGNAR